MATSNTWKVLRNYESLRWYLLTCICKDMGDWLVRVSNLIVIQEWAGSGTALSTLVLSSLLPKAFLAPIGGVIADRFDKRHLMIILDGLAGFVVLGFLVAVHYKSTTILFVVTAMRSAISAVYYPVTHGLIPLMVPDPQDMQYTGTLLTSVYGLMSMVGGLIAGGAAVALGLTACYAIDTGTYFLSSLVMWRFVRGNFKRQYNESDNAEDHTSVGSLTAQESDQKLKPACFSRCRKCCSRCFCSLINVLCCGSRKTFKYLATSGCAMLIFLKATDSLIWGPGDIVGVEIATVRNPDGSEDEATTGFRMGWYYCVSGLGVFVGPMFANLVSNAERPASLQRSCCLAIFVAMTGWIMAGLSPSYKWYLLASFWSGLGYGTLWAYSSLLLQLLVDEGILGRVLSLEYFFYVLAESFSSSVTGPLFDYGYTTSELCYFGALLAFFMFAFWSIFHMCGRGAAHPRFNQIVNSKKSPDIPQSIEISKPGSLAFQDEEDEDGGQQSTAGDTVSEEKSLSRRKGIFTGNDSLEKKDEAEIGLDAA